MGSSKKKTAGRKRLSLGKQTVKDLAASKAGRARGGAFRGGPSQPFTAGLVCELRK